MEINTFSSFKEFGQILLNSVIPALIALLGAIILVFVGWFIGSIISKGIQKLFEVLKIDSLLQNVGLDKFLAKMELKLNSGFFVGEVIKWFIVIAFVVAAFDLLGLREVNVFIRDVILNYIPKVIVAAFIIILAALLVDFMTKLVSKSAKAVSLKNGWLLTTITKYAIWIFAIIIALSELGIAPQFMQILFTGIVATLVISLGLAFGLGGKDAASEVINKLKSKE